jgi:DNA-binding response OmpR family regulator
MKNILIVDNDLGLMFWLGAALVDAGYRAWPAGSLAEAISVVGRKPSMRLDLLIVNASLPGVSKLIAHFRRTQPHLNVMALGPQGGTLPGVNYFEATPGLMDDAAKQEWVRAVKRMSGKQNRAA